MSSSAPTSSPNVDGYFGEFGGAYVSETLVSALNELTDAFYRIVPSPDFQHAFNDTCKRFIGRPTPLLYAENLSKHAGGARIYLKREDLNHTGAHKINNALGQMLLASAMGKRRIIAETGAGQHGVAAATVAARFGVPCVVYMGAKDVARQEPNVARMRLLGADVVSVTAGAQTLKDALNEAMRDWVTNVDDTFYIIGTAAGPHPYPLMVREFVSVIGRETREQIQADIQQLPDAVVACVGGGSNAIGIFSSFIDDSNVALIGVEAGGRGITLGPDHHAAPLTAGTPGILHGSRSFFLQDEHGQICEGHSISAGLDYPGVGPEHAWLKTSGRASYVSVDDDEAVAMFHLLTRLEGIMPALESSHAVAYAYRLAQTMRSDQHIVVNLSGRGDKDMASVAAHVARKHNDN